MSTVVSNSSQIGQSGTATNNFTIHQPVAPDGTLRIANGNAASPTDLLAINSSGAIGVGSSPSYGTTGQVLTSAGSGATPTWAAPVAQDFVLQFNGIDTPPTMGTSGFGII